VPLPTVADMKTYLGLTGSQDDTILADILTDAIGKAERDTGRSFATASNVVTRYSSDGQSSLVVHDRPWTDANRTVVLGGVTMVEETDVWFLPDRRDQNISATIQLRYYDRGAQNWYKADSQWFDKNLDSGRFGIGSPNDLVITGVVGHPFPVDDVVGAIKVLAAWLYWNAKSGASGTVTTPTGEAIDLGQDPPRYVDFVQRWTIHTAVTLA
jgi:hypothetical protein